MTDRNRTASGRKRKGRIIAGALLTVLAVLVIALVIYFNIYYHAVDVDDYLAGSETVTVEEFENGWYFHGENADTALIFYPGAKVEASAYAPLMFEAFRKEKDDERTLREGNRESDYESHTGLRP